MIRTSIVLFPVLVCLFFPNPGNKQQMIAKVIDGKQLTTKAKYLSVFNRILKSQLLVGFFGG